MAKSSLYGVKIVEVKPRGCSDKGQQSYTIICESPSHQHVRHTKRDSTVNYDAKTLKPGDEADLLTDGRGSVIMIEVLA